MNEWNEKLIGEVTLKVSDRDYFTPAYVERGVIMISPKDITSEEKIDFSNCKYITREAHELNYKKTDLKVDDLVFTRIGALLGKVCIVEDWMPEFSILHSAAMIRVNREILPKYLMYFIKSYFFQSQIKNEVQSIGVPDLGLDKIKRFKVFYPQKISTQKYIAQVLSIADAVIEKTQATIAKYKAIKQGMLHDLFTRGIDLKTGKLRPRYEDAPELYKESKLGWVPKEWEVDNLKNFCEVVTGSTPPTAKKEYYGDDYLFVSPADIHESLFISQTEKMLTKEGFEICRQLPKNTICVVCIGSTIGKIAVLETEGCTNQQINSVICNNRELSFFYFYAMLYYNEKQFRKEAGLQAVPIVNKSRFENFILPVLDQDEAIAITSRLITIDNKLQSEQNYLHKLQEIKTGLMGDLLSGRKRVKIKEEVQNG